VVAAMLVKLLPKHRTKLASILVLLVQSQVAIHSVISLAAFERIGARRAAAVVGVGHHILVAAMLMQQQ
jgi:hypothetical protein